jgi:hypothetical protein
VLREIESHHPDVEFDWPSVREQKQVIDSAPEPRRRRRSEEPAAKPKAAPAEAAPPQPARPAVPSTIEGSTPAEQMAFLALWYPQLRDRIAQRTSDPGRRDALLALAERLNASAWTDADEITAGMQGAAEALDRLSHVFARRRRRARKRTGAAVGDAPEPTAADPDTGTDTPDAVE